jgi:hypothetical protein
MYPQYKNKNNDLHRYNGGDCVCIKLENYLKLVKCNTYSEMLKSNGKNAH